MAMFSWVVDEVELLDANPQYATVRLPSGRESTVSIQDLAPRGHLPDSLLKADGTHMDGTVNFSAEPQVVCMLMDIVCILFYLANIIS